MNRHLGRCRSVLAFPFAFFLALPFAPAVAGTGAFEEGNPWFRDYEQQCRVNETVAENCRGSILDLFRAKAGTKDVRCDFKAFWRVRDTLKDSQILPALPWQYGLQMVLDKGGVCTAKGGVKAAAQQPPEPPVEKPDPPSPELALVRTLTNADSRALDHVIFTKLSACGSCKTIDPPTRAEMIASGQQEYGTTTTVFDCAKTIPDVLGKMGNRFAAGIEVDRELIGPFQYCAAKFFPMGSKDECTATIKTFRELRKTYPALGKSAFRTFINETCGKFFEKPAATPAAVIQPTAPSVKAAFPSVPEVPERSTLDHGPLCYPARTASSNAFQQVRTGPEVTFSQSDTLRTGEGVYVCSVRRDWARIVYSHYTDVAVSCNVDQLPFDAPYEGPCRFGWVPIADINHFGSALQLDPVRGGAPLQLNPVRGGVEVQTPGVTPPLSGQPHVPLWQPAKP